MYQLIAYTLSLLLAVDWFYVAKRFPIYLKATLANGLTENWSELCILGYGLPYLGITHLSL